MRPLLRKGNAATLSEPAPQADAVTEAAAATGSAELVADSLSEYGRAWLKRVRTGESGMLPVIAGLILIVIIFQTQKSVFLSAGNITNLLVQGNTFVLLGMAEAFVLLLGEIDLSLGYVMAVGAVVTVWLSGPPNPLPWWVSVLAGLATTSGIGFVQGLLITKLRLPSFVVTLAGLLGWEGVLIFGANTAGGKSSGGTISVSNGILRDLVNGNMAPAAGWIVMALAVLGYA
ncbi:MAG: ABC transporter permease subunit, partial [Trebonia sp.]